jgi:hypothetical protein
MLMRDEEHFCVSCFLWLLRSPELTVSNFFLLWGCFKGYAHRDRLHTTQELKYAVREEITTINQEM